jgi:DNA-binding NtrC family response regulator
MHRLLFVDDDANLLAAVRRNSEAFSRNWEFSLAPNALIALDLIKHHHFDVLVTDIQMPTMNGAQLLNEVAKSSPLIMRIGTSGAYDPMTTYSMTHEPHYFLSKPFTTEALIEFVDARFIVHKVELRKANSWLNYITRSHSRPEFNYLPKETRSRINKERLKRLGITCSD